MKFIVPLIEDKINLINLLDCIENILLFINKILLRFKSLSDIF